MTDNDIIKAFDILDKFEFFGGQRARRLLWFNKPADIQEKDIGGFNRDIDFLKAFINRQKAEIKRLTKRLETIQAAKCVYSYDGETVEYCVQSPCPICKTTNQIRAKAIKEFAERFKKHLKWRTEYDEGGFDADLYIVTEEDIDYLVKEMTEEKE